MRSSYKTLLAMLLLTLSLSVEAHTTAVHIGTLLDGVVHLFSSPDHLLLLLLGGWAVFRIFFVSGSSLGINKNRLDR